MAYEVLARKYRPRQFAEVVGQSHVTQTLANAIRTGRVAHAYLFVGPRGVGKTTIARIFAKALNCVGGPRAVPCDRCESCLEIMAGRSLDVLEIDGASNNGVEQVRDLRESARYLPARGPYKIYIIDEVHMLSISAFNALLKTLEEPPPHVKFVLATTEPQKVPATIASRCQRFDLRRITTTDIVRHLKHIAMKEGIEISEDALLAIARGADGGLRDAESALDQLRAFCSGRIEEADVLAIYGLASRERLDELAAAVLEGDWVRILTVVDELDRAGKDLGRVLAEVIEWFRNLLVLQCGEAAAAAADLTEVQRNRLQAHTGRVDRSRVLRILETLLETEGRLRTALSRRVLVETALFVCARQATTLSLEELVRELARLKAALGGTAEAPVVREPEEDSGRAPMAGPGHSTRAVTEPGASPRDESAAETVTTEARAANGPRPAAAMETRGDPRESLRVRALQQVDRYLPPLKSDFEQARIAEVREDSVVLQVPRDAENSYRALSEATTLRRLERVFTKLLGRSVRVAVELDAPPVTRGSATEVDRGTLVTPASAESPDGLRHEDSDVRSGRGRAALSPSREDELRLGLLEDPDIRATVERFEGKITHIRPRSGGAT